MLAAQASPASATAAALAAPFARRLTQLFARHGVPAGTLQVETTQTGQAWAAMEAVFGLSVRWSDRRVAGIAAGRAVGLGGMQAATERVAAEMTDEAAYRRLARTLAGRGDGGLSAPDETFEQAGEALVHSWNCGGCRGRGEVRCSDCHGRGKSTCSRCVGSGRISCTTCHGRTQLTCRQCNGHQRIQMGPGNAQPCYACSGGRVTCTTCRGAGRQDCPHYGCFYGQIRCNGCAGAGNMRCRDCAGTGHQSDMRTIGTYMARKVSFLDSDMPRALADTASHRFGRYVKASHVILAEQIFHPARLTCRYELTTDWVFGTARVRGLSWPVMGFGPQIDLTALPLDLTPLLRPSLERLEKALATRGDTHGALQAAMQVPVNHDIVTAQTQRQSLPAEIGWTVESRYADRLGELAVRAIETMARRPVRVALAMAVVPTFLLSFLGSMAVMAHMASLLGAFAVSWVTFWLARRLCRWLARRAVERMGFGTIRPSVAGMRLLPRWGSAVLALAALLGALGPHTLAHGWILRDVREEAWPEPALDPSLLPPAPAAAAKPAPRETPRRRPPSRGDASDALR